MNDSANQSRIRVPFMCMPSGLPNPARWPEVVGPCHQVDLAGDGFDLNPKENKAGSRPLLLVGCQRDSNLLATLGPGV